MKMREKMDNYKFARIFERLAIKVVEEHLGYELDYEKSHVTRATRDYGIDSVIFFKDRTIYSSTIEAKLRDTKYTLALKDIASSILFFLVRKGDEHFIVSNVYITEGTIEILELLNLQTQSKVCYIDGEKTKIALENIFGTLTDSEEIQLAELLIQNFNQLKLPQKTKILDSTSKIVDTPNELKLLTSRKVVLDELEESIRKQKRIIALYGKIGIGKRMILEKLNRSFERSSYCTIMIDVYINNTIDTLCYEITQKILGLDLKQILCMFTENEIKDLKESLNEIETEYLDNIFKIFNDNRLSNEVAVYLAKLYLKNLFEKCNQLKYVIEIMNYSYTSQEVYDFLKNFIVDAPENVSIIFVFSEDISSKYNDFSIRYKQLYSTLMKEVCLKELSIEETALYLKRILPHIDNVIVAQVHEFTGGIPFLLQLTLTKIKKMVIINRSTISSCLSSLNVYLNREFLDIVEQNTYALKFFFVLHLCTYNMKKTLWKAIEKREETIDQTERQLFRYTFLENLQFIEEQNSNFVLRNVYMYNYINDYYEKNDDDFYDYARSIKDIILSNNVPILTRILIFYYCDDKEIISEYKNNRHLWMFKTNISWQIDSLKYICKFFLRHESEEIDYILDAMKYYLEYLNVKKFHANFEKTILKKIKAYKNLIENNFSSIPTEYTVTAAKRLASYYRYQYSYYRCLSRYNDALNILEKIMCEDWFGYLDDSEKIELERFVALLYKSLGDRNKFFELLNDIISRYPSNPHAKVIYWANIAATYYTSDARIALTYLEKCELENFRSISSNENKLYLWVTMDKGIISFYNKDTSTAKIISQQILNASEKINYMENTARAYNLLGAIYLLEGDFCRATEHFYNAVTRCVDEKSEAFFHFAVNYLVTNNKLEIAIVELIISYVKEQSERLLSVFETENLQTCRWFVSLYAFYQYLHITAPQLQKELELVYGDILKPESSSLIENYKIQNIFIVLF